MCWIRLKSGVSREEALAHLKGCDEYNGIVSILTSMEFNKLKLNFCKFHGASNEKYERFVASAFLIFNALNIIDDQNIVS